MSKSLHNITVLVADDAPFNLMIMSQLLANAGANVIAATNGREVLQKLESNLVDVVLMDLQMPVLDGFETTQIIRRSGQWYRDIPIMAVTAEVSPVEIEKGFQVGINDFITKAASPDDICQRIIALLHPLTSAPIELPSDNKPLDLPPFDLSYLKEVTNGEGEKLMTIVNNLIENAPLLLEQSTAAAKLQNWEETAFHLHKLKGLVGLFFMPQIVKIIQEVEDELKLEKPNHITISESIAFISTRLAQLFNLIINNLKEYNTN